jgi:signal transduction histidine kinase
MGRQTLDHHHDSLRSLLHELLERREYEKREAALTLHDEIGQDLALLSLQLSVLQKRGVDNTTYVASIIPELKRIIADAQRKVRDLEFKLYPKIVELSLTDAVKGLLDRLTTERGYLIEYHCPTPIRCGTKQAMCLYRSIENFFDQQDTSGAAQWSVRLEDRGHNIVMSIAENTPSESGATVELNPLNREYIRSLGGQLAIDSSPNRMQITLPAV